MAKKQSDKPKTLGDKIADVVDHVLHPEASQEAPVKKEEKAEASEMSQHKKFDKFKNQEK